MLLIVKPQYEATALIQIKDNRPFVAFPVRDESSRFAATQLQLLVSPVVLDEVAASPGIAEIPELAGRSDSAVWLRDHIEVTSSGRSELYEVTFASESPEHASQLVNAVVDRYLRLYRDTELEHTNQVLTLLEGEQRERTQEIASLRQQIHARVREASGTDPYAARINANIVALNHPLVDLQQQVTRTELDLEVLAAKIDAYQKRADGQDYVPPPAKVDRQVREDAEMQELQYLIAQLRLEQFRLTTSSAKGESDPQYQKIDVEVRQHELRRKELREKLGRDAEAELRDEVAFERVQRLEELKAEHEAEKLRLARLQARYQEQQQELQVSSGESLELQFAQAELERKEKVYALIADRAIALRTEERAPNQVRIVRRATPPKRPVELFPLKALAASTLGCLLLPFLLAFAWERLSPRIRNPQQLRDVHLAPAGRDPSRCRDRQGPLRSMAASGCSRERLRGKRRPVAHASGSCRHAGRRLCDCCDQCGTPRGANQPGHSTGLEFGDGHGQADAAD